MEMIKSNSEENPKFSVYIEMITQEAKHEGRAVAERDYRNRISKLRREIRELKQDALKLREEVKRLYARFPKNDIDHFRAEKLPENVTMVSDYATKEEFAEQNFEYRAIWGAHVRLKGKGQSFVLGSPEAVSEAFYAASRWDSLAPGAQARISNNQIKSKATWKAGKPLMVQGEEVGKVERVLFDEAGRAFFKIENSDDLVCESDLKKMPWED